MAVGLLPLAVFSQGQSAQVEWIGATSWTALLAVAGLALAGLLCSAAPSSAAGTIPLRLFALPLLVVPPAVLMLLSVFDPMYRYRYVLYSTAGLALLLGAGLDWVLTAAVRRRARGAAWLAVLATGTLAVVPAGTLIQDGRWSCPTPRSSHSTGGLRRRRASLPCAGIHALTERRIRQPDPCCRPVDGLRSSRGGGLPIRRCRHPVRRLSLTEFGV